jgi:hypothetical protein
VPAIAVPGPTERVQVLPRSWLQWRFPWQGFRSRQRRAGPRLPPQRAAPDAEDRPAGDDQPAGPEDARN